MVILDAAGEEVGLVQQELLTLLPKFTLHEKGQQLGTIKRELTLFKPSYHIDFNGWRVEKCSKSGSVIDIVSEI